MMRHAITRTAYVLYLLIGGLLAFNTAFPHPPNVPVALCPKVEYREVNKRGRIVRDTLTRIPEDCR